MTAIATLLLTLPLSAGASPRAKGFSPTAERGPALTSKVRMILSAKCAECHSVRLARPKGRFGHVEDLKWLASNPKFVVPFRPDESKLWRLIRDNQMPPEEAKAGSLSVEQKQTIRAWIEAGATTTADAQVPIASLSATDAGGEAATESDLPFIEHLLGWLGKFHVVIVHFPIALLVSAAAGELWLLCRGIRQVTPIVRFCVLFAAAGGAAAAALGWLHAAFSGYAASSSQALFIHRWTGTAAGVVAMIVAVLSERDAHRGVHSPLFRILLFAGALLVSVAGHLGGTLVYGADYFNW